MTLTTQFYTLLSIAGMGCYFGAALDTYNLFLKRSRRSSWVVFINDFLFWVIQSLIIFYILLLVNDGELRIYLFLALLCGFSAYQALFKKGYIKLLTTCIAIVVSIYKFLKKIITLLMVKPIQWLIVTLIALLISLGKGLFSLAKLILKTLLSIIKVLLFKPLIWLAVGIWKLMPKRITKRVESFFNKLAGIWARTQNFIKKWTKKIKK